MNELILTLVAICLPIVLVVANKLIDRATIKQKDATIEAQRREINSLASEKEIAQRSAKTAQNASQLVRTLAQAITESAREFSSLSEQAKHVMTESEAIELARRQAEAQK